MTILKGEREPDERAHPFSTSPLTPPALKLISLSANSGGALSAHEVPRKLIIKKLRKPSKNKTKPETRQNVDRVRRRLQLLFGC
jgi:hypothetical protein